MLPVVLLAACAVPADAQTSLFASGQLLIPGDPSIPPGQPGHDDSRRNFVYEIDIVNGEATPLSPVTTGLPTALGASADTLYGWQSSRLQIVDPTAGTTTPAGPVTVFNATGFEVLGDVGFGLTLDEQLFSVDLATGNATAVGAQGLANTALAAAGVESPNAFVISLGAVGDTLYGVDLSTDSLLRIDPATGGVGVVGSVGAVDSVGGGIYSGYAGLTGADTNGDGTFDALFGVVNFVNFGSGTQRLGGIARYDVSDGTWDLVGQNDGVIFFGLASFPAVPEPASLTLLGMAGLSLLRRTRRPLSARMPVLFVAAAASVCMTTGADAATPPTFTIETIPPLPATNPRSQGNAINNNGLVTGLSNVPGNSEAFIYDSVTASNVSLGNLGLGGGFTSGSGINLAGDVVGTGSTQPTPGVFFDRAFVNRPTGGGNREFSVIAPLTGGDRSGGVAINDGGVAVGSSTYGGSTSDRQGFVARPSDDYAARPLGFLPGGNRSFANAINNSGLIAGSSRVAASGNTFAATFDGDGGVTALINPSGTTSSNVFGINDAGVTVGVFNTGTGNQAVTWDVGGVSTPLGFLPGGTTSLANDINNLGHIVGLSAVSGTNRAFLFQDGQMFDLNDLVTGPNEFSVLTDARGINDAGQITGFGTLATGGIRGFVMTIPEPTSAGILGLAGLGLLARRRARRKPVVTSHLTKSTSRGVMTACAMCAAVTASVVAQPQAAWAAGPSEIIDLGNLGEFPTFASGLSDTRIVSGNSTITPAQAAADGATGPRLRAFSWQNGVMTNLGRLPDATANQFSRGLGVNNAGVVVGEFNNDVSRAFVFDPDVGAMRGLTRLAGDNDRGVAEDVNNAGVIVGISGNGTVSRATRWTPSGGTYIPSDLGSVAGAEGFTSRANAVNDAGAAAGLSRNPVAAVSQATLWSGDVTLLGSLGDGSRFSLANGLNASDAVVGQSSTGQTVGQLTGTTSTTGITRGFVWQDGTISELTPFNVFAPGNEGPTTNYHSIATDINDAGLIVGRSERVLGQAAVATVWTVADGTPVDLNTFLPPDSGWVLRSALAVNERGDVAGFGTLGGQTRGFLLTAIPEPSSLVCLSVAAGVVLRRRRF